MLNFISFGSGSCGNCYYLYTETDGLLIDVGVGMRYLKKSFSDYGLRFVGGFSNILVTHDHADHIKSVGSLSKKFDIPVFASHSVHHGMDKNYCMRCKIAGSLRRYVEKGSWLDVGEFSVLPFDVPHDSTDNVGYLIRHDDVTFCLATDVGRITDDIRSAIKEADYLVIESNYDATMLSNGPYPQYLQNRIRSGNGHLSNVQCAEAIVENATERLKHVWLCHLSADNNKPELAYGTVSQHVKNAGPWIGRQIGLEVLRRKQPTGIFNLK